MPGWSLWLLPPAHSQINEQLSKAITQKVPARFQHVPRLPSFAPHITLTSNIDPSSIADPQPWLDSLQLAGRPSVQFQSLISEDKFFKKFFIRCRKDAPLLELAMRCRAASVENGDQVVAKRWVETEYDPHCSLMYAEEDIEVQIMAMVERDLAGMGFVFEDGKLGAEGIMSGWSGGRIWLVSTDKTIDEWEPVAERIV